MPQTILDRILQTKRKEVDALHAQGDLASLQAAAAAAPRSRNFFAAVSRAGRGPVNLIAEVKKASPSAGVIREDFDPVAVARQYAAAGASALSVLTDEPYFQGRLEYLAAVRAAVNIPILRKDFIIDPWQVYQSRAAGADAILLIVAALSPSMLMDLMILATELRMSTLVEVHDADEMMLARSMIGFPHKSYGLLGINNRNLATFEVDLNTTVRLAELAGEEAVLVSESGIKTHADVTRVAAAGVRAVLVGQALMESGDIARSVANLLGEEH
ncbi:MAG: indole-3-glycerol phosphate synthase TrpC [Planctomycetaceae bacterium]|nr:indole-3-glycerol phosphate synthase TrpC [Planctomycetaceae bacterium]